MNPEKPTEVTLTVAEEWSDEERAKLQASQAYFAEFVEQARLATEDFIRSVLTVDAAPYLENLELFLPTCDELLRDDVLDEETERWLRLRLMYFFGEYLRQRFEGQWTIDDTPGSPTFAHYVVDVPLSQVGSHRVTPFELARRLLQTEPPRSVYDHLRPVMEHIITSRRLYAGV